MLYQNLKVITNRFRWKDLCLLHFFNFVPYRTKVILLTHVDNSFSTGRCGPLKSLVINCGEKTTLESISFYWWWWWKSTCVSLLHANLKRRLDLLGGQSRLNLRGPASQPSLVYSQFREPPQGLVWTLLPWSPYTMQNRPEASDDLARRGYVGWPQLFELLLGVS